MKKPSLILILLIVAGAIGFVLGHLNLAQLSFPNTKQLSTYPSPDNEISKKCVEDLVSIKGISSNLQERYSKLLTMGTILEETKTYFAVTSESLYDIQGLSERLNCPNSYSLPINLQNKIVSLYKKIDTAYFFYSKDLKDGNTIFLQTGKLSDELDERWHLEQDALNYYLNLTGTLNGQYSSELAKIHNN